MQKRRNAENNKLALNRTDKLIKLARISSHMWHTVYVLFIFNVFVWPYFQYLMTVFLGGKIRFISA